MNAFESTVLKILIVRPGATELDEQRRISGTLDLPLSQNGVDQVSAIVDELRDTRIDKIFSGPGTAAKHTAELLARSRKVKVRFDDGLRNLDYGLWHGKRLDELKDTQPKLVKLWQDHPRNVCPPNGETIEELISRVKRFVARLLKKNKSGSVVVVAAEPVACVVKSLLEHVDISANWTIETNAGSYDTVLASAREVAD